MKKIIYITMFVLVLAFFGGTFLVAYATTYELNQQSWFNLNSAKTHGSGTKSFNFESGYYDNYELSGGSYSYKVYTEYNGFQQVITGTNGFSGLGVTAVSHSYAAGKNGAGARYEEARAYGSATQLPVAICTANRAGIGFVYDSSHLGLVYYDQNNVQIVRYEIYVSGHRN